MDYSEASSVLGGAPPGLGRGVGSGAGVPDSDGRTPGGPDGDRLVLIAPAMIAAVASMAITTKAAHPRAARPFGRLLCR
jgi:hypothetical protein